MLRSRRRDTHRAFPDDDVGAHRVVYRRVSTHLRPRGAAAITTIRPRSAKPRNSPSNARRGRGSTSGRGAVGDRGERAHCERALLNETPPKRDMYARPTEPYRVPTCACGRREVNVTHRRRDTADRTEAGGWRLAGARTFKRDSSRGGWPISYRPRIMRLASVASVAPRGRSRLASPLSPTDVRSHARSRFECRR